MSDQPQIIALPPCVSVEPVSEISPADLSDLCDATEAAIESGGGFGWVHLPARDLLENYWRGVVTMPARKLFIARLDGTVCGSAQLVHPPRNNEAQSFAAHLTGHFIAPWARKYGLARMLVEEAEKYARDCGFAVVNLDVRETMASAIKLYESLGYQCCGTHPLYARVNDAVIPGRFYYKVIDPALTTPQKTE
ncbi:MAG: GNAT family N-acetyltransferase [Alphaproteobacteria bacterium]|nr:GNAT family N-acetyltransferase [Alphaproteobacteria bacterium]